MTSKAGDRKGPWHHAAVAALQGASIEEQLEYLDPDQVEYDDLGPQEELGPALGLGALEAGGRTPLGVSAPRGSSSERAAPIDTFGAEVPQGAELAAVRRWERWDAYGRGRLVRR